MFKEYYVVARYIASIPEGKDITSFVLDEVERDIRAVKPENMALFLNNTFSVIEGQEIDIDSEEDYE